MTYYIPAIFRRLEAQSGIRYQQQATGMLDIPRLANGHSDYWISPSPPKKQKNKKLILADWSAQVWTKKKIYDVRKMLKVLMTQGLCGSEEAFEIYLWQSGELVPFTMDKLSSLNDREIRHAMMPPYNFAEISHTAYTQYGFTHDDVHILDDYWIQQLLSEDDSLIPLPLLRIHEFAQLSIEDRTTVWRVMLRTNQSFQGIEIRNDEYSVHSTAITEIESTYEYVSLGPAELIALEEGKPITLSGKTLNLRGLVYTQELSLFGAKLTNGSLSKLLTLCPQLKTLKFSDCEESMLFPPGSISKIEEIEIKTSNITIASLESLLADATHLKRLYVSGGSSFEREINLKPGSLPLLEDLTINNLAERHCVSTIQAILLAAPHLKTLDLSSSEYLPGTWSTWTLPSGSLPQLEELNLAGSNINVEGLQAILSAAPHLKTINLSGCRYLAGTLELDSDRSETKGSIDSSIDPKPELPAVDPGIEKSDLPEIKTLNLFENNLTNYDPFFLMSILKHIPFFYLEKALSFKVKPPCFWDELEELNLKNSNITLANLKTLLKSAPNLKRINLTGTYIDYDDELNSLLARLVVTSDFSSKGAVSKIPPIIPTHEKESATVSEVVPTNSTHDAKDFKDYRPRSKEDQPFAYKGINKTKNQGMIIEKLSQYFTLTQQHIALIPKMRDGICNPLSHYFIEHALAWQKFMLTASEPDDELKSYFIDKSGEWGMFMLLALEWDGKIETLSPELTMYFDGLTRAVENYLCRDASGTESRDEFKYLGDNLGAFCESCSKPFTLQNPWHVIAIQPPSTEGGVWIVYDPNFIDGPRIINKAELLDTIHSALGNCISVASDEPRPFPKINSPAQFIREGGLISLIICNNTSEMLGALTPVGHLTREDFDGLFLRDISGIPAWVLGMQSSKTAALTSALLQQFMLENPRDYSKPLHDSMAAMSSLQRQEFITKIIQFEAAATDRSSIEHLNTLVEAIRSTPEAVDYERALQTWKKETSLTKTVEEYCQQCVTPGEVKKRLIECTSTADVNALHFAFQAYCRSTHRPIFYVNSPDDLICSSPAVYRGEGNTGEVRRVGGPLYDFLRTPREAGSPAPVIVVNYDNFEADDIVRFNSLLDKTRKADGEPLPVDTMVIGLINKRKPDCYQGSDFYSRFDVAENCPIKSPQLKLAIPGIPTGTLAGYVIHLFQAPDWKELLLGRWVLDKDKLVYKEGELQKALAEGATTFEVYNGLWEDENFVRFWQEACQLGAIEHAGRTITLPKDMKVIPKVGYDWASLKTALRQDKKLSKAPHVVLNPMTLGHFFSRYQVTKDKQLEPLEGFIQAARGKVLHVHVTRELSENEWARLLAECKKYDVTIAAYGAELPAVLQSEPPTVPVPTGKAPAWDKTLVVQSTDVDTTVEMLTKYTDDVMVIDVSECSGADLLEKTTGGLNRESLLFEFNNSECEVSRALEAGKRVILKGHFSLALADELATLVLERQGARSASGTLMIIADDSESFGYASTTEHNVSIAEKKDCLGEMSPQIANLLEPYLAKEPLSQLKSRRDYLMLHPDASSDVAWAGMRDLSGGIIELAAFDARTSKAQAAAFTESRKQAINQVLDHAPYVFISGLSGVGKSTFVERELCGENDILFQGEASILRWASAPVEDEKKRKLLFLDEATLSKHQWSDFEGLFATPPGILIDGTFHPLSPNHKVIFAGNPVSYGDERTLGSLFKRHGNAVVFQTIPTAVLYERILNPVFVGTPLAGKAEVISACLLKVYSFLCAFSSTDVLISPRELQMMAMMVVSYCNQQKSSPDIDRVTEHFAYELAKNLVPQEHRRAFNNAFKPKTPLPPADEKDASTADFIITASRAPVSHLIDELLTLRELRRTPSANEAVRYGGLGGIILEGESGMGKSEMVFAKLIARGYKETHDFSAPATDAKPFYRMPVSLSYDEKTKLLIKAFNEGAVVIIDEINSSPMMERLLNELLMGLHKGKHPEHPGFMIIGTQNPVTMAGRRAPSTALSRRLITVDLPPYSAEEMQSILVKKGLSRDVALELVNAYQKQAAIARKDDLKPAPTFRDIIKFADATLKAHEEAAVSAPAYTVSRHSFFAPVKEETKVEGMVPAPPAKP